MLRNRITKVVLSIVLLLCLTVPGTIAASEDVNPHTAESSGYRSLSLAVSADLASETGSTGSATGLPTPWTNGTIPTPPPNGTNTSAPATQPAGAGSTVLVVSVSILGAIGVAGMLRRRGDRGD